MRFLAVSLKSHDDLQNMSKSGFEMWGKEIARYFDCSAAIDVEAMTKDQ